eukprot:640827-Prymnesium_polylepis.1
MDVTGSKTRLEAPARATSQSREQMAREAEWTATNADEHAVSMESRPDATEMNPPVAAYTAVDDTSVKLKSVFIMPTKTPVWLRASSGLLIPQSCSAA